MLRASRLPVPAGTRAIVTPLPASACAADRTVPSPPQTITTSAPDSIACLACPSPGSSSVVSSHRGSDQPCSVQTDVMASRADVRVVELGRVDHDCG